MPIERSAGAVIFKSRGNKIYYLLLRYKARHWDFSKGKIEKGETPKEAAIREIKEETGIAEIKFMPGFKETIRYFYKRDEKIFLKIAVFFLAQTEKKRVKISQEHQDFKWLPYEKALKQLTFSKAKEILKKANDYNIGQKKKNELLKMENVL